MTTRIPSVLLALAAALFATSCAKEAAPTAVVAPPEAVRVLAATSADVPLEFAAIGNVEAISTVDVKARVTAPILRVHFAEGQDVKQGDYLFELDPETFNRQIAEIDANVAKDAANEKQAEANILRDDATWKNLDAIAKRSARLNKEGILSAEQSAQAESNADAAKASVDADRAARDSAQAAAKADRARLEQIRLQLDYTKIRAPISGRAGAIAAKQGNLAKENDNTLVTLLQTSPVYVSFPVPENLLAEIRKYNATRPLEVSATSSDGKTGTGTLQFIDNTVDTTTGTIRLKANFANADRALWPGQFVNVSARLAVEKDRILIASKALQTGPNGKYVWVLNAADSTVSMRDVTVLRLFNPPGKPETAVIGTGLKPGDSVVSEGQMRLAPNAKVRVLTATAGGN